MSSRELTAKPSLPDTDKPGPPVTDKPSPPVTDKPSPPVTDKPSPSQTGPPVTDKPSLPVSDPQWQWLSYAKYEKKDGTVEIKSLEESKASAKTDGGPFKVYYRRRVHTLWPDVVEVSVASPSLITILQRYLPDHGDLKSLSEPKVDGRDLYAVLQSLKRHALDSPVDSSPVDHPDSNDLAPNGLQPVNGENHGAELGEDGSKNPKTDDGILHLKHLVRFLEKEYEDALKRESRMREEKRVAWDMLWTFLPKGTKAGYYCDQSGELLCAVVAGTYYQYNLFQKSWSFRVDLNMWNFNGKRYTTCKVFREIAMFQQECQVSELAVCPIEVLGNPSDLNAKFLANGRRFYELAMKSSNRFILYKGPLYQKRRTGACWQLYKENGDGRVMIDLCSFATMNPDYPMGSARPPTTSSRQGFRGIRLTKRDTSLIYANNLPFASGPVTANSEHSQLQEQEEVFEGNLVFAPAVVYGFSFKLKKWGCFAVSQFSEVVFDKEAFQELTMEPETKSLLYDLVAQYVSSENEPATTSERVDPISDKGEGCILLCFGPPGTGKTLTAESIAENMERPLWAMSVTELGTTPNELEQRLLRILDIAARWQAVLLLDEADIYLEKRTSGADVVRNAMTGVFLRQLEYFRGILFLTTNRIGTFDDAFRSRISLFLHYCELGSAEKAKIWETLLRRASVKEVTPEFCREMAGEDLNGREIRNAIHTAQVLAKRKRERLAVKHVKYVTAVLAASLTALNREVLKTG